MSAEMTLAEAIEALRESLRLRDSAWWPERQESAARTLLALAEAVDWCARQPQTIEIEHYAGAVTLRIRSFGPSGEDAYEHAPDLPAAVAAAKAQLGGAT